MASSVLWPRRRWHLLPTTVHRGGAWGRWSEGEEEKSEEGRGQEADRQKVNEADRQGVEQINRKSRTINSKTIFLHIK